MTTDPSVSIIVPTYNRLESLKQCIEALQHINYPENKHEIIIVNDGSTDGTAEFLGTAEAEISNLSAIHQENAGVAAARNTGVEHADGEYIFFTDDDCLVPEDWIRRHLRRYDGYDDIAGVDGIQWPQTMTPVEAFKVARHWALYEEPTILEAGGTMRGATTNNLSYKRKVFNDAGMLDESLVRGSDTEHSRRVLESGYRILNDPSIRVTHLKIDTLTDFLNTKRQLGASIKQQEEKHDNVHDPIMTPSYLLNAWKHFIHHAGYRYAWAFPFLGAASIAARKLGERDST